MNQTLEERQEIAGLKLAADLKRDANTLRELAFKLKLLGNKYKIWGLAELLEEEAGVVENKSRL